jgi:hypothetical protein
MQRFRAECRGQRPSVPGRQAVHGVVEPWWSPLFGPFSWCSRSCRWLLLDDEAAMDEPEGDVRRAT